MKTVVVLLILLTPLKSLACSVARPEMIPPKTKYGEFTYVYPPTEYELFVEELSKNINIAVVDVYVDFHYSNGDAQTEFMVLHGWGEPNERIVKYIRRSSSCGDPENLNKNERYVAILDKYSKPWIIEYEKVKSVIESKGKPDYSYTRFGRLLRQ